MVVMHEHEIGSCPAEVGGSNAAQLSPHSGGSLLRREEEG